MFDTLHKTHLSASTSVSVAPSKTHPGLIAITVTRGMFSMTENVCADVARALALALGLTAVAVGGK